MKFECNTHDTQIRLENILNSLLDNIVNNIDNLS